MHILYTQLSLLYECRELKIESEQYIISLAFQVNIFIKSNEYSTLIETIVLKMELMHRNKYKIYQLAENT